MKKLGIVLAVVFLALLFCESKAGGDIFQGESIGKVLSVNNDNVVIQGVSKVGAQKVDIKIVTGKYRGNSVEMTNLLSGSLEYDEFYKEGDKVLVFVKDQGERLEGKILSLIRVDKILILTGIFLTLLFMYAGITGVKALLSFAGTVAIIWKYLIPALKNGDGIFSLTVVTLVFLSGLIIFLVAGFTKKGFTAFLGTLSGLFVTGALTFFFGDTFKIDGMNQPFAQSLLFSTGGTVDILSIFYAAIVIGASGAAMDIAMDMAATIEELKINNPHLKQRQLVTSGFNVGRSVIGTMTTTLLLAYSGGFLTLLILFLERDTTFLQILNMKMMTSEIIKILIGSIGLIVVAPITTFIGAMIYSVEDEIKYKKWLGNFKKTVFRNLKES